MDSVFLQLVNVSITAGWVVLAILLLRLVLKKAPKWTRCLLWLVAGVRLVFPFSIESIFSLIPSAKTIDTAKHLARPYIDTGFSVIDNRINDYLGDRFFEGVTVPTDYFSNIVRIAAVVWVIGMTAMLLYSLISYVRLRRSLRTATLLRDNLWESEAVKFPFILGVIRPKIYLPYHLNTESARYVIAHERAHLKRRDHWIKPIAFALLCIYWFNPLMWVAYILLCRDIELACDEKVIRTMGKEERQVYSMTLVQHSISRRHIAACPLAFGEVGVKERIKTVMHYKKPAFWLILTALLLCGIAAVCFLTNPLRDEEEEQHSFYATVLETEEKRVLVEPVSGSDERNSADRIWANLTETIPRIVSGDTVRVIYNGQIDETYPAQISSVSAVYIVSNTEDIEVEDEIRSYYYSDSPDPVAPTLLLSEKDQSFQFTLSVLSSYLPPVGKYEWSGNRLICRTDDGEKTYVFRYDSFGDALTFLASESSGIPVYAYEKGSAALSPVPDGATFTRSSLRTIMIDDKMKAVYDTALADIDGDGTMEECVLEYGRTSGVFSFVFSASKNGVTTYQDAFFPVEWYDLLFVETSDGKIKVKGVTQGDYPEAHFFDISVKDGHIVLSENGKTLLNGSD